MEIQEIIEQKKSVYNGILSFIDEIDDISVTWPQIKEKFDQYQESFEKKENITQILRTINKITKNHHRDSLFYDKTKILFLYFEKAMKQNFTNIELFTIYKNNKKILLQLLEMQIIKFETAIIEKYLNINEIKGLDLFFYFFPEIKSLQTKEKENLLLKIQDILQKKDMNYYYFDDEEECELNENGPNFSLSFLNEFFNLTDKKEILLKNIKKMLKYETLIYDDFVEERKSGENESYICSLIRKDLIDDFIIYVNKTNLSLSKTKIRTSFFETNSFLINKEPKLIEYALFFGSIRIFNYLKINDVKLKPLIWIYAIHSNNAEIINLLEENHVEMSNQINEDCLKESIKCHHNGFFEYIYSNLYNEPIINSNIKIEPIFEIGNKSFDYSSISSKIFDCNSISCGFKYYNYQYMEFNFDNKYVFLYLITFDYYDIVELLFKMKNDIKNFLNDLNEISFFFFNMNVLNIVARHNHYKMINLLLDKAEIQINECQFSFCTKLTEIKIPSFITSIKSYTFLGCLSLKQITIPSSVTKIDIGAFEDCQSLTQITIPSSVTSIGNNAFYQCISLEQIIIPSSVISIGEGSFKGCSSLKKISIPQCLTSFGSLESFAFHFLPLKHFRLDLSIASFSLESLPLKSLPLESLSVEFFNGRYFNLKIECSDLINLALARSNGGLNRNGTFAGCSSLTEFVIPSSMTLIQEYTFSYCVSLKKVTFMNPSSITSIENHAFKMCTLLEQIIIPSSVKSIECNAFERCSSLKQITIPSFMTVIKDSTFKNCTSLKQITIPSSIESIECNAFEGCSSIEQMIIPSFMTVIKDSTFKNCTSLKQITIPSSIKTIECNAFEGCSSLKQITIPSSIKTIECNAFKGCSSLKQITIPSSIESIECNAFEGCSSIEQMIIPSFMTIINGSIFKNCTSLKQITIPSSIKHIVRNAFEGCSSLKRISFEIPSSIISIGIGCFTQCSSLVDIKIPSSVTKIGSFAFSECINLKEINLPPSLISINQCLFKNCSSLSKVNIPKSVKKIRQYAFYGCTSLLQVVIPQTLLFVDIDNTAFPSHTTILQFYFNS